MKKLVITSAVVACAASVVFAQVYSQNVVGYIQTDTPAADAVDALNITPLVGTSIDIQDAIVNLDELNAATSLANADKIYVWTGTGYDTYGLYAGASNFWMNSLASGWNKAALAAPSVASLERGVGVWYQTGAGGAAASVMTVGDVPDDGTFDTATIAGVDLITYPYASTINLQDLVVSNATASASLAAADKIYIWTGSGYDTYGLYQGASNFWMNSLASGWNKAALAAPSDADVVLGKGVWYQSADGAKTIGFAQNYNLGN